MGMQNTITSRALFIQVIGRITKNISMEKNHGLMGHHMKGNILKERKMGKAN